MDLERMLEDLGTEAAPAGLVARVLTETGTGDRYFSLDTPIGAVCVAHGREGISAVSRMEPGPQFETWVLEHLGRTVLPSAPPPDLVPELQDALAGRPSRLDFDLRGLTEFERAVLMKALEIPRGEVRSYGWIAREIGRPKAVRAVGTALAHNPIPVFIPCHRVVRSDGRIGQYSGGGPEAKRKLLAYEGVPGDLLAG